MSVYTKNAKPPWVCESCKNGIGSVWEHVKGSHVVRGIRYDIKDTVYHEGLPTLGLDRRECDWCKKRKRNTVRRKSIV